MSISKKIIAIEGNIGVGKTTLIDYLKINNIFDAEFLYEPVDDWLQIKDSDGKSIFQKYNENREKYAFDFQHIAYYARMKKLFELIYNSEKNIIFMDRSLGTDKNVFEKMLYDNGMIDELENKIYEYWDSYVQTQLHIKKNIIYLKCDPSVAYERMIGRGRKDEMNIKLDYIKNIHDYHNIWIDHEIKNNEHVIILDCNNGTITKENIDKIKLFVSEC